NRLRLERRDAFVETEALQLFGGRLGKILSTAPNVRDAVGGLDDLPRLEDFDLQDEAGVCGALDERRPDICAEGRRLLERLEVTVGLFRIGEAAPRTDL